MRWIIDSNVTASNGSSVRPWMVPVKPVAIALSSTMRSLEITSSSGLVISSLQNGSGSCGMLLRIQGHPLQLQYRRVHHSNWQGSDVPFGHRQRWLRVCCSSHKRRSCYNSLSLQHCHCCFAVVLGEPFAD